MHAITTTLVSLLSPITILPRNQASGLKPFSSCRQVLEAFRIGTFTKKEFFSNAFALI
jgi:hypothetical protein